MPLNPPPVIALNLGLVTIDLTHALSTRAAQCTFAVTGEGSVSAATVANRSLADFQSAWGPEIDSQVTIGPAKCVLGVGTTVPLEGTSTIANTAGANVGSTLPGNCAVIVRKVTGISGRKNRGRIFIPWCVLESLVTEVGVIDPATVASLQTRANAWLTAIAADNPPTSEMVIANKVFNQPLPPRFVTNVNIGAAVSSLTVEGTIGSQRRRIGR